MKRKRSRIEEERFMVTRMISLYCIKIHGGSQLCEDCSGLRDYANQRLDNCPFGEKKPTCQKCTVHCYAKPYRERIKEVMRFSGPRMLLHHPVLAIKHLLQGT